MKGEELLRAGLAMGLEMGGRGDLVERLESFMEEMKELGVEVKVSMSIDIAGRNVKS